MKLYRGTYISDCAPDIEVNVLKVLRFGKPYVKVKLQVITKYGYIERPKYYKLVESELTHWKRK